MKKILRSTVLGAAVGAIGLSACDAAPPPEANVSRPVEPEAIAPSETLVDLVREALADVLRDEDPYSRARRLGTLLPTLGPEATAAVKPTLEDRMLQPKAGEIALLLRYWATHEPEAAARWAKGDALPMYRNVAIYSALEAWAEVDPQAATRVAWGWAKGDLGTIVPLALVQGWYARNDPPELRRFLSQLPMGIPRQRAVSIYAAALIRTQGPEAAMRWAESLPDDDEVYKLDAFRRVVSALSQRDLESALRWCDTQCDGPYGKNMRSLIASNWATNEDPAAPMAWLSSAPPGPERDLAVRIVFAQWARTDREAALAWMAAQHATGEPQEWLRPTYPVYARTLSVDAPADAIPFAEQIEDDLTREHTLVGIVRVWLALDEAAAEEWLAQASLSEKAMEKVRAPLQELKELIDEESESAEQQDEERAKQPQDEERAEQKG